MIKCVLCGHERLENSNLAGCPTCPKCHGNGPQFTLIFADSDGVSACAAKWQAILRLQDWKITCRLVEDWDSQGYLGRICPNWNDKKATLDVNKITVNGLGPHDHEHTVVHELLHLLTQPLVKLLKPDNDKPIAEEELCINLVAEALLALERRGGRS